MERSHPEPSRSPLPSIQDIWRRENEPNTVPEVYLHESVRDLGSEDIPIDRYISRDYAAMEAERLWAKVWQMACRVEEIPRVGDHVVYDIVQHSILVVRVADDEIRAYHNSCLHRGTQLRTGPGNAGAFRCPFHGWTWNLDGSLREVPGSWDFPHVAPETFCLPQCAVDTWEGFVFVNLDPDPEPLHEYLEVLPQHFEGWRMRYAVKVAHVEKVVACNWKVAMEAFMEAYHVPPTHPEMAFYAGQENTQYDIYGRHVSRMINPVGTPSPLLGDLTEQDVMEAFARDFGLDPSEVDVPEGQTARSVAARLARTRLCEATGLDPTSLADLEVVDGIEYAVFPNFFPFMTVGVPLVYRFRPNGIDPDSCRMDIMMLMPFPEGAPDRPPPAPVHVLQTDDWLEATELGELVGRVLNQDQANMPRIQRGLHASRKGTVTLGNYQEMRIRHFHQTLESYVRLGSVDADDRPAHE